MKQWLEQNIAPFATAAVVCVLTVFCGCERKPEVHVDRGGDAAYQKELKDARARQGAVASTRARIASQMAELVARARATLPKGATDEQVQAELEGHPEKYPGWKALAAAFAKANAGLEREFAKAQGIVRARILKEAADRRAVAEGRAVAKKPAASK